MSPAHTAGHLTRETAWLNIKNIKNLALSFTQVKCLSKTVKCSLNKALFYLMYVLKGTNQSKMCYIGLCFIIK